MRVIPDQLKSKNLVPFRKRRGRYKIPGMTTENEVLMNRVDADLSPEEQTYVGHYLGYADALIRAADENATPEPGEADSPESVSSAEESLKHQPAADQATITLAEESSSATNDPRERAA